MSKTIWIIAGESSGDAYGACLALALNDIDSTLTIRGMGGEEMRAAGVDLMVDSTELGVIGFVEVVRHLPAFFGIFGRLVRRAAEERPDAVVLIDYPGFNLRFAAKLHALGISVVYYVSPQVWAWGKKRIPRIAETVDRMLVIFPFEESVYADTKLQTEFVGHPLLEVLDEYLEDSRPRSENLVVLLPGSRRSEIDRLLQPALSTAEKLHNRNPDLEFVLSLPRESIGSYVRQKIAELREKGMRIPDISVKVGNTRGVMRRAAAGLAASGTVTVEAAILGLPLVVMYRLNPISLWWIRRRTEIKFFTMVNLIADEEVFEEFLQESVTADNLSDAVDAILPGGRRRENVLEKMAQAVDALGVKSDVCRRAAEAVMRETETADPGIL